MVRRAKPIYKLTMSDVHFEKVAFLQVYVEIVGPKVRRVSHCSPKFRTRAEGASLDGTSNHPIGILRSRPVTYCRSLNHVSTILNAARAAQHQLACRFSRFMLDPEVTNKVFSFDMFLSRWKVQHPSVPDRPPEFGIILPYHPLLARVGIVRKVQSAASEVQGLLALFSIPSVCLQLRFHGNLLALHQAFFSGPML